MSEPPTSTWRAADLSALVPYGWSDDVAQRAAPLAAHDRNPARVVRVDRGGYVVATPHGVTPCRSLPQTEGAATGDWVAVRDEPGYALVLDAVAPRQTAITRRDPSDTGDQVLAANVDSVFITIALDRPLRLSRVERSLVLVWDSGAVPVVVLTKIDLSHPVEVGVAVDSSRAVVAGVEVVAVSAVTGEGCDELRRYTDGATVALIGESGAGKSTLANRLLGEELLTTGETRSGDAKGRHTTTARELVPLPTGGVLIDTPGLRAVGLAQAQAGVAHVFADVEELAAQCRFRDCHHGSEPGCAIQDALEAGELSPRRYDSYRKVQREQEWVAQRNDVRQRRANAREAGRKYRRARKGTVEW